MTVESVTFITDLNPVNPAGTDPKSEGDDHIRNIKTGLDGTFPNFAGIAMTATEAELNTLDGITATTAELNYVDGVTSNIQTQMDLKAPLASPSLTGNPTAPTQTVGDNSTKIATTAYAESAGGLVPILTQTANSDPNIDFTGLDGTYDEYLFVLTSVIPATNAALLTMLVGDSGSYRTSANYQYHVSNLSNGSAAYAASVSGSGTSMYVSGAIGTAAGRSYSGEIRIHNPSNASLEAQIVVDGSAKDGSGNPRYHNGSGQFAGTTFAIDRIRFVMSTDDIASGEFTLYGRRKP